MSELFEKISVDVDLDNHDEDCYFCNAKEDTPETKDLVLDDDFDEDTLIGVVANKSGIKHHNDSGKLGQAIAPSPSELYVTREGWGYDYLVESAAHHCIPGNACLAPSKLYKSKKYLRVKGQAKGNIGYDVNSNSNGVWLPGNYAFSTLEETEWGTKGTTFEEIHGLSPTAYVFAAIEDTGRQFHDAHTRYNKFVLKKLNDIYNKLKTTENEPWCPEAAERSEERPENQRPLYILANRLATLSMRMRRMLIKPYSNWFINIYTSSFSEAWMKSQNENNS